jgi:uncharacterized membrane protein
MKRSYTPANAIFLAIPLLMTAVIMLTPSAVLAAGPWNFTVQAQEVKPVDGEFRFPVSAFADGRAQHFVFKQSPSQWIRFFVVKSSDGKLRAAFDACDVCFRHRKGYVQRGDFMVCVNCGLKFKSTRINEVRGGCNPAPLRRRVQGQALLLAVKDVQSGLRYFQ